MRQVQFSRTGPAEVMSLGDAPMPEPAAGQVRLRVVAAGINRADVAQRMGGYAPPPSVSPVLGLEVSGTVDAVGSGVGTEWLGRALCSLTAGAGYSEWVCVPVEHCMPIPVGWTWAQAAAFPEAAMTVWSNIFDLGRLGPGESLLVHGGTSGVGACAIAFARARGHQVLATAGNPRKCQALAEWGAHAIDYRNEDFVARAMQLTAGRGVDVILDMVGGGYVSRNVECAAMGGRIVQIAFQAGAQATIDLFALMRRRAILTGSLLRPRSDGDKAAIVARLRQHIYPLLESGAIGAPHIDSIHDFSAVVQAHLRMESSQHIAKMALAWSPALAGETPRT